MRFSIIRLLF
jgi:hypothetical protein